jgi:hypothetical protein
MTFVIPVKTGSQKEIYRRGAKARRKKIAYDRTSHDLIPFYQVRGLRQKMENLNLINFYGIASRPTRRRAGANARNKHNDMIFSFTFFGFTFLFFLF